MGLISFKKPPSIAETRSTPNHLDEFHVGTVKADNSMLWSSNGLGNHTPTVTGTLPLYLPVGGVAETREALLNEGASVIFDAGQKKSAFSSF